MEIVNRIVYHTFHVKKRNFDIPYVLRAQKRARRRARAEILEMFQMTWNILSFDQKVILSIFKF